MILSWRKQFRRNCGKQMKKLNVALPLALAALAFWLCLTLGVSRLLGDGAPQSLFDAVAGSGRC
jgi:hypothetical protein